MRDQDFRVPPRKPSNPDPFRSFRISNLSSILNAALEFSGRVQIRQRPGTHFLRLQKNAFLGEHLSHKTLNFNIKTHCLHHTESRSILTSD